MSGACRSAPFCAFRNIPDCEGLEILQTDFRREMGCSESFVGVRGSPRSAISLWVCDGVFADDFGK